MRSRRQAALQLAIAAALLLGCGGAAGQAVLQAPLSLEAGLRAIREAITNWPQFAAANNLSGWGADPSIPPCLYTGVTCDADGRLSSVSLQCPGCKVKAQGHLAEEVAELSTLTALNMQSNQLNGTLPAGYGAAGVLPRLLNLVLSSNQLSGTLPLEWGDPGALPALSLLALGFNDLTGELPAEPALPSLLILRLHNNQLTGTLPPAWGTNSSMPHLRVASLQGNRLSGPLPKEWADAGKLSELEELHLQDNQLTGGLPPLWGGWGEEGLPALRVLNLSNNAIGGTLPYTWSQQRSFPMLRTLALSNISLQGTLPASWDCMETSRCGLASLQALWLDGNNLSGPIPPNWASAPANLEWVFVQPGNPLLCVPAQVNFPFRLCDANGGPECRGEARIAPCPAGEPQLAAAGTTPNGNGSSTGAAAATGGGSSTGAIVGGVVGGIAAAAAALVLLLVWRRRRRRRRRRRARALPIIVAEDKSSVSLPPSNTAAPPTNGALASPPQPLLPSPFAALAAELEPSPTHSSSEPAMGALAGQRRLFQKSASAGSLTGKLLGFGGADIDHALDAEIDRHFSIEMASLAPPPPLLSPLVDVAVTRSAASTAGTGGTASDGGGGVLRRAPSRISSGGGSATLVPIEESLPRLDPFSDWQITPEEIEICKRPDGSDWELGSGGFGKVYKALRHGAQPVAVKVLALVGEARYQSQEEAFVREIALLRACRDPNVVAFLGACIQTARTMLVTEYCDGGNLTRNLMAGRVTWYRRGKKIALDVARGLTYLHAKRIIHFDLKSPNVLLARDGTAKISDVGMAKIMAQEFSGITGNVGTLAWAAPEMLLGARCTEKADIYAYGVVLWEICTAHTPVRGQLRDVQVPEECPAEVRELILDCLATNPRNRPTAKEIVERLRALPDPPGSTTAGAAGGNQRSRLGRRRSSALPPPGAGAGGAADQLAAVGAAAAGQPATAAARLAAVAPAGLPSGRAPPPRRSSESDSSLRSIEGAPGSPPYLASPQPLPTAYASPAPGAGLALATQWLAAAAAGGSTNSSIALAGRRAGSMIPGALPASPTTLQPAPIAAQRLKSASSSPPGSLPEPPPQQGPTAQRQASLAGAAMRVPRPPRPAPSIPLHIARQASLDDPASQLAELQRTLLGPTGMAGAEQWQRRLQQAAQRPAAPLEQVPYELRGSQLLPPLGQGEQSVMLGPQGQPQPQPQLPQAPPQQQQQQEGALPPFVPGQPMPDLLPSAGAPPPGPSLAAQLAKLQGRLRQPGSPPPLPSVAGQPPQQQQEQEQAGGQWGAAGEPPPVRLSPASTSAGTTVRSSSDPGGDLLAEVQQHEHAALNVQQHEEHAALLAAQRAAQRRMTVLHRTQQLQMVARHQHEMDDVHAQEPQPQQELGTLPHQEQGPAAGSPLHAVQLQSGGPPPVSPFGLSEYLLAETNRAASPRFASPFAQPAAAQQAEAPAPAAAGQPAWASPFAAEAAQHAQAPASGTQDWGRRFAHPAAQQAEAGAAASPFAAAALQHQPSPPAASPFAAASAQQATGPAVSPFAGAPAQQSSGQTGAAISPFAAAAQQGSPPAAAAASPFAAAAVQQAAAPASAASIVAAGLRQGSEQQPLTSQGSQAAAPAGSVSRLSDYLRQSWEKSVSPSHISPFAQQPEPPPPPRQAQQQVPPQRAQQVQQVQQVQQQQRGPAQKPAQPLQGQQAEQADASLETPRTPPPPFPPPFAAAGAAGPPS